MAGAASIFAGTALLPGGWADNVRIVMSGATFSQVTPDSAPEAGDTQVAVLLPGMGNLHSHAFQRAIAGLTEQAGMSDDSFWSWRTEMYRFALSMNPDHAEAVAAQLYVEMLEAGFTRVGEFHYLHHDRDGSPYADPAEMAGRIVSAADETGIGLTLLPVFYAHSGFGGAAPTEGQRRFIHSPDDFARLIEAANGMKQGRPTMKVGIAPHSLRAVTPDEFVPLLAIAHDGPIHIHVAEQVREVEDCLASLEARPVEWLLANLPVDGNWCLIHATHMTRGETVAMAKTGAVAGLCPVTEANLGDGIFPGADFVAHGGRYGIGSDSNVLIGLGDELRMLEYSQRLGNRARTVLAPRGGSTGRALFDQALAGGAAALAAPSGLSIGNPADCVSMNPRLKTGLAGDRLLDSLVFANGLATGHVWVAGRQVVTDGRHVARDRIASRYQKAMAELSA